MMLLFEWALKKQNVDARKGTLKLKPDEIEDNINDVQGNCTGLR